MKDRYSAILAFIGLIVLCIIYVFNADPTKTEVTFGIGDAYVPKDQAYNNDVAANEIFAELTGSRTMHCPQTEIKSSSSGVSVAVYLGAQHNTYGTRYLPIDMNAFNGGVASASLISKTDVTSIPNVNAKGEQTLASYGAQGDTYYELVAPFQFLFYNNNTDGDNSIVIVNMSGNCKVTYSNVTNWFCAGDVGSTTTVGNGIDNNSVSWEDHGTHHLSVFGRSSNAGVHGGSSGGLVGYGTSETSIKIEKLVDGSWTAISIYELIYDGVE